MRKKGHILKRCLGLIMALMMLTGCFGVPDLSGGIFPVKVSAKASGSLKKKAAKAYRKFVKRSGYGWFCVRDIDRDGLKELVLSHNYSSGVSSSPDALVIYKYRKGAVKKIGEDSTAFGYRYNKKTRRIHGLWGGSGSVEDWYLTITKSGKLKRVYLSLIEVSTNNGNPIYRASYAGKKISQKAYHKKKNEWNRNYRKLKMYRADERNIKKYIS